MHDKNKGCKKFYITWEISLKCILFWQYHQEPYLEPNQKPMVELFWWSFIYIIYIYICIFNHLCIVPYVFFRILLVDKVLQLLFQKSFFSFGSQKKWLLVALASNDWTRICLDRLSIGALTEVVFWAGSTIMF